MTLKTAIVFSVSAVLGCAFGYFILSWKVIGVIDPDNAIQFQFLAACRSGDLREMSRLHRLGASPVAFANNGYAEPFGPPILEAAENARPDAVEWLLNRGATWDVFVADGSTPLGAAEMRKKDAERTIDILRTAGAKRRSEE